MNQTQYKNEKRFISRLKGNLTENMRECYDTDLCEAVTADNEHVWNALTEDSR